MTDEERINALKDARKSDEVVARMKANGESHRVVTPAPRRTRKVTVRHLADPVTSSDAVVPDEETSYEPTPYEHIERIERDSFVPDEPDYLGQAQEALASADRKLAELPAKVMAGVRQDMAEIKRHTYGQYGNTAVTPVAPSRPASAAPHYSKMVHVTVEAQEYDVPVRRMQGQLRVSGDRATVEELMRRMALADIIVTPDFRQGRDGGDTVYGSIVYSMDVV